ncbi:hypothetical protein [Dyella lutea]|uniref:Flagellar protein FliT n=1 Tax=Dyella lutea TaxID=2950441 RepID=A0ABT1F8R7_9GAMM|nr:hypothetical protein [Dyella lutea]MCP1373761.1 hypothetical protein [Dyella lutea]
MESVAHPDLQRALELSARMLSSAREGDWAAATAHQAECDRLLRQAPVNAAGLMALRRLYQDQQELLGLAAAAREAVEQKRAHARTGHRAVSAYITAAGSS